MADLNNEAQELAATMQQVNRDMAMFGKLTAQTAEQVRDANMKAKYGIDNFTAGMNSVGGAVGKYVDAHVDAAKAVYNGERGAKAFNKSLDGLTEAAKLAAVGLAVMVPGGPLIKGLVAGLGLLAAKVYELSNEYTKAANTMSDTLFKGFQDMSAAGGSASDGMKGLFEDTKKLGLSMSQLDSFVQLVSKNSGDLVLFAGSVTEGRKKFAQMGKDMEPFRESLMNMGMTQEQINDASMQYLRLQSRIGQTQNLTTQQLAEGARKYLVEQDALTKLTGMSRQEQEQALEAARSQQRFRAKLEEMRNSGDAKQIAAADEMETTYKMLYKRSKEAAQGYGDLTTNMIGTEASQKLLMSTNGEALVLADKQKAGIINGIQAFEGIGKAVGKSTKDFNMLYQTGVGEEFLLKISEGAELGIAANKDLSAEYLKIRKDQKEMGAEGGKAADAGVAAQVQLTLTQQAANKALEKFVNEGVVKATQDMNTFAQRVEFAGKVLGKIVDGKFVAETETAKAAASASTAAEAGRLSGGAGTLAATLGALDLGNESAAIMNAAEEGAAQRSKVEKRAAGGPVAKDTPYLVGEKGPELFVPTMTGEIVPMGSSFAATGGSAEKADQIERAVKEIISDTRKLEKITDTDLQRTQHFSDVQKQYFDLRTTFYEQQIKLMTEEMNAPAPTPQGSPAGGIKTGGGIGLKAPTAGGGSGAGGIMSQSDLAGLGLKIKAGDVQAEGAGISPKIIEMAEQVQANMPNFAYFSGFNDKFHQEKSPSSFHTKGQAMDFALSKAPTREEGQEIVNWLKSMGASTAIDEYNNPSSKATAGHIHAQIAGFADGGIANEPQIAMVAEKGPEAMVPLKNGAIPVEGFSEAVNALRSMQEQMGMLALAMNDMIREQRNTNDINTKILQVSAN